MNNRNNGFTVIELIFIIVLLSFASVFVFIQKQNLEVAANDRSKKTAINAMYYSLEEVFYPTNKFYPQSISSDNLKSVDPKLFTDPEGHSINTPNSSYTYNPINCVENRCKGYTLTSTLVNEADYKKSNRKN